MRFLARRVYLALVVVLCSARRAGPNTAAPICAELAVSARTLERWRRWWRTAFVASAFWQVERARFMPPLAALPADLIERFGGVAADSLSHLLRFLGPLSIGSSVKLGAGARAHAEDAAGQAAGGFVAS